MVLLRPNRFQSDVTVQPMDGTPESKYTVISDGSRVWTYQAEAQQYAVTPRTAFFSNDLSAALGLFGGLVTQGALSGPMSLAGLNQNGVTVEGGTQDINGIEYSTIMMTARAQGQDGDSSWTRRRRRSRD